MYNVFVFDKKLYTLCKKFLLKNSVFEFFEFFCFTFKNTPNC